MRLITLVVRALGAGWLFVQLTACTVPEAKAAPGAGVVSLAGGVVADTFPVDLVLVMSESQRAVLGISKKFVYAPDGGGLTIKAGSIAGVAQVAVKLTCRPTAAGDVVTSIVVVNTHATSDVIVGPQGVVAYPLVTGEILKPDQATVWKTADGVVWVISRMVDAGATIAWFCGVGALP